MINRHNQRGMSHEDREKCRGRCRGSVRFNPTLMTSIEEEGEKHRPESFGRTEEASVKGYTSKLFVVRRAEALVDGRGIQAAR